MKRLYALLCAVVLAAGLTACGSAGSSSSASSAAPTAEPTAEPAASGSSDGTEQTAEPEVDAALNDLLNQINDTVQPNLPTLATQPLDLGDSEWMLYNTGLDAVQSEMIDAGVLSTPMIGSQAYSLVIVRVKDEANTQEIAQAMADNADPTKWICVTADDVWVAQDGDLAMLAMVDTQLGVTGQQLTDAFLAAAGEGGTAWQVEFDQPAAEQPESEAAQSAAE
ncbi:MAG: hypothetical protein U0L91_07655 [Gemmiger sp.]|uniref:hypothetical protein n=1 Tax=Gemmiger sp. TaxID=2049027 RepID=UPI002E7792C3|nr:hypothetical protein [Gemmiger sp.]MEE0801139.1 hypothetical protein [Gemmiger sp.]